MTASLLKPPVISSPTAEDVLFLILNLRKSDQEETFGTLLLDPNDPVGYLADTVFASAQAALACELYSDPATGKPFAIAFISRSTLTSAHFNFLCTDFVGVHMRWITAQVRGRLSGVMAEHRLERVECRARNLLPHIKWLQSIGASFECLVPGFSTYDFAQLAWCNEGV